MRIETILNGLKYKGQVQGKRQVYYVFEGRKNYILFSYSKPSSGYFNIVPTDAVEQVRKVFAGQQGVTRRDVENHPHMSEFINQGSFDALQMLYVLAATKQAKIDTRHKSQALYFNIRPKRK